MRAEPFCACCNLADTLHMVCSTALSHLPLRVLHALGTLSAGSPTCFQAATANAGMTTASKGVLSAAQVRGAIAHNGRMMLELPRLWFKSPPIYWHESTTISRKAYADKRGIVFLTPHTL